MAKWAKKRFGVEILSKTGWNLSEFEYRPDMYTQPSLIRAKVSLLIKGTALEQRVANMISAEAAYLGKQREVLG
ncbi:hypothetical protein [Treponema sp. R6D11]